MMNAKYVGGGGGTAVHPLTISNRLRFGTPPCGWNRYFCITLENHYKYRILRK